MATGFRQTSRKPSTISVFAPAKINLALRVTGQRADGYHLLESLVVFAQDLGDLVSVSPADRLTLTVTGPLADGVPGDDQNLVLRAATALASARDIVPGAALTLDKHLPHGAGLGGDSSDAAAALKALAMLWQVPPLSASEALHLGADVPVCLTAPSAALMSGIGEDCRLLPALPDFWLVLVNPGVRLATPDVFKLHDQLYAGDNSGLDPWPNPLTFDDMLDWLQGHGNDLTRCAAELTGTIAEILDAFREHETTEDCDMSGSGSTCWGMFRTEAAANAAAAGMRQRFSDYWVKVTRISS